MSPRGCLQPRRAAQGGKEHLMRAHFGLPSVEKEEDEGRPPIAVRFEIPYFTVSGIQVTNGDVGGGLVASGSPPDGFGDGMGGTHRRGRGVGVAPGR